MTNDWMGQSTTCKELGSCKSEGESAKLRQNVAVPKSPRGAGSAGRYREGLSRDTVSK